MPPTPRGAAPRAPECARSRLPAGGNRQFRDVAPGEPGGMRFGVRTGTWGAVLPFRCQGKTGVIRPPGPAGVAEGLHGSQSRLIPGILR